MPRHSNVLTMNVSLPRRSAPLPKTVQLRLLTSASPAAAVWQPQLTVHHLQPALSCVQTANVLLLERPAPLTVVAR